MVDDNTLVGEMMSKALSRGGFCSLKAERGRGRHGMRKKEEPDSLLSDMRCPSKTVRIQAATDEQREDKHIPFMCFKPLDMPRWLKKVELDAIDYIAKGGGRGR